MSTLHLTVTHESFQFDDKELSTLKQMLAEIDKHTTVTPMNGPATFLLNEEGKTAGGYSYSSNALVQLCSILAPGLAQVVLDVAGQWRKPAEDVRMFSGSTAIETFNKLVRLRFDHKLIGLQVVRNLKAKTIDGIVGSKYRYLANSDFLARVDQECSNYSHKFREACLYGRHFVVRYVDVKDEPYSIANESYSHGFHFANSEIGGKSVRGAAVLVRISTGDFALCPFTGTSGGRVVHSGRDFEKKLHSLMGQLVRRIPLRTEIEGGGKVLEERGLRIGEEDHEKRVRYFIQLLTRRKLTQGFAKRVIDSASSRGRYGDDALVDSLPSERRVILQSRTGYDLFTAMLREARRLPIDQREIAEQVAFALLVGKLGY